MILDLHLFSAQSFLFKTEKSQPTLLLFIRKLFRVFGIVFIALL